MIFNIILVVIWFAVSISMLGNLAPYIRELTNDKRIVIGFVVLLGAPFMVIAQGIETILDFFIEGWNDNDKFVC